jgi:hypothetical protein
MQMIAISKPIDGSSLQRSKQNIALPLSETHLFTQKYNDYSRYAAQ